MPPVNAHSRKFTHERARKTLAVAAGLGMFTLLGTAASPVSAATLLRSIDVKATPAAVWSVIGPFCAIQDWLPPIGTCTEDGGIPPTRTLVTKDGAATFVETQTARSDERYFYSYTFKSSPLPVTQYTSTIKVTPKGQDLSTITWSSSYLPDKGKEKDAAETLSHVYESGLTTIRSRLEK